MFALKIVVTTIIAIIGFVLLTSALIAKEGKTSLTVSVLIIAYLMAIYCMWG